MDRTDVVLSLLLLQNSRTPYRELADKLSLSVPSVHKRIQALVEAGVIRAFTARPSVFSASNVHALAFGRSEAQSLENLASRLGKNESVYWVALAGGNYIYVGAYLRDISELKRLVAFVKKEAQMPDLTVGIDSGDSHSAARASREGMTLTSLDYRIIYALHKNSRRAISEVAEEVGASSKTVGRRLQSMIDRMLVELSIEWYPDAANDIIAAFHLKHEPSSDDEKVRTMLISKYSPQALFCWTFSNLPNFSFMMTWTSTMKELKDLHLAFQGEKALVSVMPNVLYTGYIFDTWRDEWLAEKARSK